MIQNLLDSRIGQVIISVVLGLGLAALFRRSCEGNNCIIIKSPPVANIEGHTFGFNNKCYRYNPKNTKCSS